MDAIELLLADHKKVKELFKRFEAAGKQSYRLKKALVDEMIHELAVHSVLEEQLFYPALREALMRGDEEEIVLDALEEHHVVKWTLSELEKLPAEHERFDAKVHVLIESVRSHIKEEEQQMFPLARRALIEQERRLLGEEMAALRPLAPTRPHPRAPDQPPGNLFTSPVAATLDKTRDMLRSLSGRQARDKRVIRAQHLDS